MVPYFAQRCGRASLGDQGLQEGIKFVACGGWFYGNRMLHEIIGHGQSFIFVTFGYHCTCNCTPVGPIRRLISTRIFGNIEGAFHVKVGSDNQPETDFSGKDLLITNNSLSDVYTH